MNTEPFPTNYVVVVGLLDGRRHRNQVIASNITRNLQGGRLQHFALQIDSPFGEPFAVELTTGVRTTGLNLLDDEHIDRPLAVEGYLHTRTVTDARYTIVEGEPGRTRRELALKAEVIRLTRDDEPVGTSFVQLEGIVTVEPRFGTHRSAAGKFVRTLVRVRRERPSGYPGSQAVIGEEADINVTAPVHLDGAGYLLAPGNVVRIVGQLDRVLVPLRGQAIEQRIAKLKQEWQEREAQLRDETAKRKELAAYRRTYQRLHYSALLTVMTAQIEPDSTARLGDLARAQATNAAQRSQRNES